MNPPCLFRTWGNLQTGDGAEIQNNHRFKGCIPTKPRKKKKKNMGWWTTTKPYQLGFRKINSINSSKMWEQKKTTCYSKSFPWCSWDVSFAKIMITSHFFEMETKMGKKKSSVGKTAGGTFWRGFTLDETSHKRRFKRRSFYKIYENKALMYEPVSFQHEIG